MKEIKSEILMENYNREDINDGQFIMGSNDIVYENNKFFYTDWKNVIYNLTYSPVHLNNKNKVLDIKDGVIGVNCISHEEFVKFYISCFLCDEAKNLVLNLTNVKTFKVKISPEYFSLNTEICAIRPMEVDINLNNESPIMFVLISGVPVDFYNLQDQIKFAVRQYTQDPNLYN